ncbi:unnamed protein product [Prunus brigantina]
MSRVQKSLVAHQDRTPPSKSRCWKRSALYAPETHRPYRPKQNVLRLFGPPPHSTVLPSSATVLGSPGAMATFTAPNHPIFAGAGPGLGFLASNSFIPPSFVLPGTSTMGSPVLQPRMPIPQYSQPPLRTTTSFSPFFQHETHEIGSSSFLWRRPLWLVGNGRAILGIPRGRRIREKAANVNVGLSRIRQMGTVAEFVAQFIKLSCRAVGWTDELLLGVFIGGHRCKQSRVFMIEVEGEDMGTVEAGSSEGLDAIEEDPTLTDDISVQLHAITDKKRSKGRAMKLMGQIKGIPILVFIDSGADKSFINPWIAEHLRHPIDRTSIETVVVASGSPLKTKGMLRQVPVRDTRI